MNIGRVLSTVALLFLPETVGPSTSLLRGDTQDERARPVRFYAQV